MMKHNINFDDVLQKDEFEERELIVEKNKKRRFKRKKRNKKIVLFIIFAVIIFYFLSDNSNIRVVEVNGNTYYSKQEIMNIAKISYGDKSILAPAFLVERRLESNEFINTAKVKRTWDGVYHITIEEQSIIGYYEIKDKKYLLIENAEAQEIKDSSILAYIPYIVDLSKKQRNDYLNAMKDIEMKNISLISEVSHYEQSYDNNMLKLVMQDGHIVYTTMKGLKLLDWYTDTLKGLNTTNKCILFIEETNTISSQACE